MGTADAVTAIIVVSDNGPQIADALTNGNQISAVNSFGQVVGALVQIAPLQINNVAGINAVTGFVAAVKISRDVESDTPVSLGDAIGLVSSGVTVGAGVAAAIGVGTVILPWVTALGFVGGVASWFSNKMGYSVNDLFLTARGLLRLDPLAIDLDGDGIETVGADAGVLFDHNGDGTRTGTGWVVGDDAFVVMDRDSNGLIDSGRELFGVDTVVGTDAQGNLVYATNGFDALSSLDGNGDSLFDANDADYSSVRLWRDLNQDGISQANELQSLADAGITAIDLAAQQARQTLAGGNVQTLAAGVAGIEGAAVALDLASNPFYRTYADPLDTTAVADLPDMQGSGAVRDLKEAATQSATLESQLRALATQGYVNQGTYSDQIKALIDAWADAESRHWRDGAFASWEAANEGMWRRVA